MFSKSNDNACPGCQTTTRRNVLRAGVGVAAAGAAALWLPEKTQAMAGATDNFQPYPIPWLDRNLHHNQVPMPDGEPTELSHIFHFRGAVGRALFKGEGKTGDGQTLYIGRGTDYGFMKGEYLPADGDANFGTFSHI